MSSMIYEQFQKLNSHLNQAILGQQSLVERMLIALLTGGHLLVEGPPGLAKTTAIKSLADAIEGSFHRIQFTPDLLPSDLTGSEVFNQQQQQFSFVKGPIFHSFVLADEVNRAPAKVQSALLEAMAEHQVTVGQASYSLPDLFLVMATQNPIEQYGTYPLPEAQLDRFLFKLVVSYPTQEVEKQILALQRNQTGSNICSRPAEPLLSQQDIFAARNEINDIFILPELVDYIVEIVCTTRDPKKYSDDLSSLISFGASPRATIALEQAAKARAWLKGKDYVSPDDIQTLSFDVLRHRLVLAFAAESSNVAADEIIEQLIKLIPTP